ncbi:putative RNA methyltransferase [Nocardia sp. CNY236]|uniref:putative RNA methyltransferase n=1 Tax=Nocardia sp. CNY236 TaxID=1169152 RepID=UPI0004255331|nr:methyltransferase type 11 [Nocardia sp. CNY236]
MARADYSALASATRFLACPECARTQRDAAALELEPRARALRCAAGHSFDIAKQGYVSLLTGASTKMTGDSATMLDARAAFHRGGHFAPIAEAVAGAVSDCPPEGALLEVGAGTGYYLAHALEATAVGVGIAVDVAKPAVRRCARAHPRAAAVLADAWRELPIRTGALTGVIAVFAPRNPGEVARVLADDGRFVVATPTERHLGEVIGPLGMVRVDPDKDRRLEAAMAGHFEPLGRRLVEYSMTLAGSEVANVVGMGPSAHHASASAERGMHLPPSVEVTASVSIGIYRPAT